MNGVSRRRLLTGAAVAAGASVAAACSSNSDSDDAAPPPTFVLVGGSAAPSFFWTPVVRELALRGARSLPVELPGHGLDAQFPLPFQSPQDVVALSTAPTPVAGKGLDDYAEAVAGFVVTQPGSLADILVKIPVG